MIPVFPPKNGKIDADRLRVVFDDIAADPSYIAAVIAGIKAWESRLGIPIINLDPGRPATSAHYVILVGNGTNAAEPNKTLKRSYVGTTGGYFFYSESDAHTFAHEFGHLLGLADRYYEGYEYGDTITRTTKGGSNIKEDIEGVNASVPMSQNLFSAENYDPATNLMSGQSSDWTISSAQLHLILSGKEEPQLSRHIAGVFDSRMKSGPYALPASMYLEGGQLKTVTKKGEIQPIAGYTLLVGVLFQPKHEVSAVENAVKSLWLLRSRFDDQGKLKTKSVRVGKVYRGIRKAAAGPRIHMPMMRLIGKLAGV